jgi:hypothetical protein
LFGIVGFFGVAGLPQNNEEGQTSDASREHAQDDEQSTDSI